jgi:hypothetical protein
MVIDLKPIFEYGKDTYSQNGEDGIVEFLFENLGIKNGLVLEVGAHNGVWCSNTRKLYEKNEAFKALLIEGDSGVYLQLVDNTKNMNNVDTVNTFISSDSSLNNSIDEIIKNSRFRNEDFVLASIDIDGEDYNVWKQMIIQPKLIIIEVPIFLESHPEKKNILEYIELGNEKGYVFLGMSGILNIQAGNMIFLRNDLADIFNLPKQNERILLHNGKRYINE